MKLNIDMKCHNLCPKMGMGELFAQMREYDVHQIQLALGKSISDYDFTTGHYSSGPVRTIARELGKNQIHVAVLGCYINPTNPIESRHRAEAARFIEHMKYAGIIGADMVGTEVERLGPDFGVTKESHAEDVCRLLLRSIGEIVAVAGRLGVIVGVGGVFNHTLHSPARMKRLLEDIDSPNVEVILDAVSLIHPHQVESKARKRIIDRAFAYYGDHIGAPHVKDFIFGGQEQLFRHVGDGLFRYEPLIKHIKERKPHIAMLLENPSKERYHEDMKFLQQIYDRVQREVWGQSIRDNRP